MKLKNLTKKYSLYMVEQQLKREKRLGVSLKKKKTLLSLRVMVHFLLVLTLGISTTSCSPLLQKAKSGSCSRLGVDLERWRINQFFALFDIADNITYKSRQNFTYRHFTERLNIYKGENFNYKVSRVNL